MRSSGILPSFLALFLLAGAAAHRAQGRAGGSPAASFPPGGADDPIFATYAAPMHRSEYLVDEGYHFQFYDRARPLAFTTDTAGDFGLTFTLGGQVAHEVGDYATPPRLELSLASLARFTCQPFGTLDARGTFAVYSSRVTVVALTLKNRGDRIERTGVLLWYAPPGRLLTAFQATKGGLTFVHSEPREGWSESPPAAYENDFQNLLVASRAASSVGAYPGGDAVFLKEARADTLSGDVSQPAGLMALRFDVELAPGAEVSLTFVRGAAPASASPDGLRAVVEQAMALSEDGLVEDAAAPYRDAYFPPLADQALQHVYWGALSLTRQCMLPPEGRTRYNYYVFSREPTWSWGHDGQVFHESLSMLAYAYMDPKSAMDSQRVFIEAQDPDGYIPYRIGPYIIRTFPVKGEKTSSAPFFSWTSLEVYRIARWLAARGLGNVSPADAGAFLDEAYAAGSRFAHFWLSRRDADGDGLLEWGGHAVLESVRDSLVPIWDLLGRDDPSAPSLVEALDLSAMLVKEMRSLADMARELGKAGEAGGWDQRADTLAARVNETMWDGETSFYYNVDRATNRFAVGGPGGIDLRRMEIIGFLPLWAGIVPQERARALVAHLVDPAKFWRRYGVPTLAADDPGYQPLVTRCCQWNGAVWLEWNYLVFDGLRRYGFHDEARELGSRMIAAAATQLRRNHRFWESYSPDHTKLESPKNYIWDSILARVIIDLYAPQQR